MIYRLFKIKCTRQPLGCPWTEGTKDNLPPPLSDWLFCLHYVKQNKIIIISISPSSGTRDGYTNRANDTARVCVCTRVSVHVCNRCKCTTRWVFINIRVAATDERELHNAVPYTESARRRSLRRRWRGIPGEYGRE